MLHLPNGFSLRPESGLLGASEKPSEHTEAVAGLRICPFSALQTHGCRDGDCGELALLDPINKSWG